MNIALKLQIDQTMFHVPLTRDNADGFAACTREEIIWLTEIYRELSARSAERSVQHEC